MKVEIVFKRKKETKTVEFTGTKAMEEGFKYIIYNSPMEVIAIRVSEKEI